MAHLYGLCVVGVSAGPGVLLWHRRRWRVDPAMANTGLLASSARPEYSRRPRGHLQPDGPVTLCMGATALCRTTVASSRHKTSDIGKSSSSVLRLMLSTDSRGLVFDGRWLTWLLLLLLLLSPPRLFAQLSTQLYSRPHAFNHHAPLFIVPLNLCVHKWPLQTRLRT